MMNEPFWHECIEKFLSVPLGVADKLLVNRFIFDAYKLEHGQLDTNISYELGRRLREFGYSSVSEKETEDDCFVDFDRINLL